MGENTDVLFEYIEHQKEINQKYVDFIVEAILFCKIDITDIPVNIMLLSRTIYISVFRVVRGSDCKKVIEVFNKIIDKYEDVSKNKDFMEIFSFTFYLCDKKFGEKQEYWDFRKSVPKQILEELERINSSNW